MGSIPTRSRHACFVLVAVISIGAAPLGAQVPDTVRVPPRVPPPVTTAEDTVRAGRATGPPVSPKGAFLRSLLVPGWGQSRLDRGTAGALFVTIEVGAVAMLVNSRRELSAARRARRDSVFVGYSDDDPPQPIYEPAFLSDRVRSRRQQVEDWAAIVIANHLLSGLDALIAAHLWDLPAEVSLRSTEQGTVAVATLRW